MKLKIPLPRNLFWPHCEEISFSKLQLIYFIHKKNYYDIISISTRLGVLDCVFLFLRIFALFFLLHALNSAMRIPKKFFLLYRYIVGRYSLSVTSRIPRNCGERNSFHRRDILSTLETATAARPERIPGHERKRGRDKMRRDATSTICAW